MCYTFKKELEVLKAELLGSIEQILKERDNQHPEYMRSKDVRKMLNISDSTLQSLRTRKVIPAYKLGDLWLYKRSEIEEAIEVGKVQIGGDHE